MKGLKDSVYLQRRVCNLPGLLNAHSVFIMALVRYDFCVIAYGMERVADRRLWGILRAGQVTGPLDMTLKEMEKVGHGAFVNLGA